MKKIATYLPFAAFVAAICAGAFLAGRQKETCGRKRPVPRRSRSR